MGKAYARVPSHETHQVYSVQVVDPIHVENHQPHKLIPFDVSVDHPVREQRRRRRSPCMIILLSICACCTCLAVLPMLFVFPLAYVLYSATIGSMVEEVHTFTVTEPIDLPIAEYPKTDLALVKDRVSLFFYEIHAGRVPTQDLVITTDEINGLIASSVYLRGNAFVDMDEDNKLTIKSSIPVSYFYPGGQGRYFVSTTVLKMSGADTLAVDLDAPIDAFHGKLLSGWLQFDVYVLDDEEHYVASHFYGNAFGKDRNIVGIFGTRLAYYGTTRSQVATTNSVGHHSGSTEFGSTTGSDGKSMTYYSGSTGFQFSADKDGRSRLKGEAFGKEYNVLWDDVFDEFGLSGITHPMISITLEKGQIVVKARAAHIAGRAALGNDSYSMPWHLLRRFF